MPALKVTIGGDASEFVSAMKTVEQVSVSSGAATATALRKAEAAILAATEGTKLNIQQTFLYEAALQKVRAELKLVEQAEIASAAAAKKAAEDRVQAALTASRAAKGVHDEAAIQKQAQYEAMFKGSRHGYYDEAAIQKAIQKEQYTQFWMQNTSANPTLNDKIKAYYERKKAMGGVNVYAPTGFGEFLKKEAAIGMEVAGQVAGKNVKKGFLAALQGSTSASSQLISVVSNTLSSLGAGMSPGKILAQQGPNFVQAFTLMGQSARALIMSLLPIAGILAGVAAVGYGIYRVHKYFKDLQESIRGVEGPLGRARANIEELNRQMRAGADAAADFRKWMASLGNETMSVADKTEILLKRLREQFRLESEIAKKRGASPQSIVTMELEQLKKEQDIVNRARELAYEKKQQHLAEARAAQAAMNSPENMDKRVQMDRAKAANELNAAIATAIEEKLGLSAIRNGPDSITKTRMVAGEGGDLVPQLYSVSKEEEIARLSATIVEVTVEGKNYKKSLAEAVREMKGAATDEERLRKVQEELAKVLNQKKQLTEQDVASIKSLGKQEAELITAINLKNKYGPELAGAGQGARQPLTSREQIGAYSGGGPVVGLLDVARKQHQTAMKSHATLENILSELKNGGL